MKRILYMMHIPWAWIKQRPHFIAEKLANDYEVDVFYKKANVVKKKNLLTNVTTKRGLNIKGFRILPFNKIPLVKCLNIDWLNKLYFYLKFHSISKYDYVWITSPIIYKYLKGTVGNVPIIYDCMDDILEFPDNKLYYDEILSLEQDLVTHCEYIVFSAEYLKNKVIERTKPSQHTVIKVVNNAVEIPQNKLAKFPDEIENIIDGIKKLSNPIIYVGAISSWFDFDLLIRTAKSLPSVNYVLIGPTDVKIPNHPQIHYLGTVKRDYIFHLIQCAKGVIMPFVINELIRSVNPVKIYEYIYSAKPIVAPYYEEMEKFSNFVSLYNSSEDFLTKMENLISGRTIQKTIAECHAFVNANTWESRYSQIKGLLKE